MVESQRSYRKSAEEAEEDFRRDLAELLEKHLAKFDVTDDGADYGMQSGIVVVTIMGEWDEDGNQLVEFTQFQL